MTLTFDLSLSHGLYLLANFQLAMPFRSRLEVRYGADRLTNGQTDDGDRRLMPPLYGGGA